MRRAIAPGVWEDCGPATPFVQRRYVRGILAVPADRPFRQDWHPSWNPDSPAQKRDRRKEERNTERRKERRHNDPEYRERHNAYHRAYRARRKDAAA